MASEKECPDIKGPDKYYIYIRYKEIWKEFIILKEKNQDGSDITDITYDNLPNLLYGKIQDMGNFTVCSCGAARCYCI